MTITLNGATITRIEEELKRLEGKRRRPYSRDSIGDDHRAIEDFIETVLPMLPVSVVQRACDRKDTLSSSQWDDVTKRVLSCFEDVERARE